MDINNEYYRAHFPDPQDRVSDRLIECSNHKCRAIINIDIEGYINWYGSVCCYDVDCLINTVDAREIIAGEELDG
jgi:hypothetical protein